MAVLDKNTSMGAFDKNTSMGAFDKNTSMGKHVAMAADNLASFVPGNLDSTDEAIDPAASEANPSASE